MFQKSIQYALEKLGKSKSGFERTVVSKFKRKRRVGSGNELVDYSRAPCLGADQKARGLWERDCHFFTESVVTTTHEQNIICSKSHLDSTTHEQTIICRQLFAGHVVGSRPMKRKKKMHRMIISIIFQCGVLHHTEFDFL